MQIFPQLAVVALAMNLAGGPSAPLLHADAASGCVVTLPNASSPPGTSSDHQWYGNGKLRVSLYWPNGTVVFRPGGPGFVEPDGALGMKFGWWRGVKGQLSISGKRLDAPALPLRAEVPVGYGNNGFQATYIIFPTPGCWEVTGKVGDTKLIFVTRVVKIGNGPRWHREG